MKKNYFGLFILLLFIMACQKKGPQFEVSGTITEAEGKTLYFEAMTLNGVVINDSVKLDNDGNFCFHGNKPLNPEFYRLRIGQQGINICIDSTETIGIQTSLNKMATNYQVTGSANCEKLKEISRQHIALQNGIRAIATDKTKTAGEQMQQMNSLVEGFKEKATKEFIYSDPGSPAAYYTLFLTLGNNLIYNPVNNPKDIRLFTAVANTWNMNYPNCPRTENLKNIALQGLRNTRKPQNVTIEIEEGKIHEVGIIEVNLKDLQGKERRLSDLKGKVVLLDFTAYSAPYSQQRIMEMRSLYKKYAPMGFEIYQVSLDPNEHYWKTACDNLPWICVHDPNGPASTFARVYNVGQLPSYFLIDRNCDLVARETDIPDLAAAIEKLL